MDCFAGQSPGMWANKGGHFSSGVPGSAREVAKSKPELLNEWLGSWGFGQELAPGCLEGWRAGSGSRFGERARGGTSPSRLWWAERS